MKVLIESRTAPFFLAHGGEQTQILRTAEALQELGIEVEMARWWDGSQTADIIHCFGTPDIGYIEMARKKGIPVVNTTLFTETCNRTPLHLKVQGFVISTLLKLPSRGPWGAIKGQLKWQAFPASDCNIVGLKAEVDVLKTVYSVPPERIRVAPLGLSEPFLTTGPGTRTGDYLITTGTITERKRSLELARLAHATGVPICFVGKPYDTSETYWKDFERLVDDRVVRHIPHTDSVAEMIELLRSSRGYVLYSKYENWCLSAHEAVACGLPILLPDQRWSREIFGEAASYFSKSFPLHGANLASFSDDAPNLRPPDTILFSWKEVGRIIADIYEEVIRNKKAISPPGLHHSHSVEGAQF